MAGLVEVALIRLSLKKPCSDGIRKVELINIDPETKSAEGADVKHFQMTCHSGGSLSVYIEPVFPNP